MGLMPTSHLTLGQRAALVGLQLFSVFKRALVGIFLIGISILFGGAAVAQSPHPPVPPWWVWEHWVSWFNQDRQSAAVLMISALGSSGGLALSVFQVWFSTGSRQAEVRHAARIKALEQRLSGQMLHVQAHVEEAAAADQSGHAETQAMLRTLLQHQSGAGGELPAASPEAVTKAVEALRAIEDSPETAGQRARGLIRKGEVEGAFATLRAAALTAESAGQEAKKRTDSDAAEKWRRLGALAYLVNVKEALEAYENAVRLDPSDFWTFIFLARLCGSAGRTDRRHSAATKALEVAQEQRERSVALNELGDVLSTRSDLTGALEAYQEGLGIARKLAADDPTNAERQIDVGVSLAKLAETAEA